MSLDLSVFLTKSVDLSQLAQQSEANLSYCLGFESVPEICYRIMRRGIISHDVPKIFDGFTEGTLLASPRGYSENVGIFSVDLRQYEDLHLHHKQEFKAVFTVAGTRSKFEYVLALCMAISLAQMLEQKIHDAALAWNREFDFEPNSFLERVKVKKRNKSFQDSVCQIYYNFPMSKL